MPQSPPFPSPALPLRPPILSTTSRAYQTAALITRLTPIPQLPTLRARQHAAILRMNSAHIACHTGRISLPDATDVVTGVMAEVEEIAELVDDYVIFWSEDRELVTGGSGGALEWNFVRYGGEKGVAERRRKRGVVERILERIE